MNRKVILIIGCIVFTTGMGVQKVTSVTNERLNSLTQEKQNNIILTSNNIEQKESVVIKTTTLASNKVIESKKKSPIDIMIRDVSTKYQYPEGLIRAVIQAESNFNVNCVGPDTQFGNAYGLMQLLPSTAKYLGVNDILDPQQNIEGGVKYLKQLYDKYAEKEYFDQNGQLLTPYEMSVMAYNWGLTNLDNHIQRNGCVVVSKGGIPNETYNYLMKIRNNYDFNEYYN